MVSDESQIQSFFKDQTVFLTGGSGFLGKVLIEKLLRDCEDVRKIYVMIREKKGKTPEKRLEELFDYPCFDLLKSKNASSIKKVSLINGDIRQPLLGLDHKDIDTLVEETTCVIHAAANVKFDQTFKEASYGIKATGDLLDLAKRMSNLKVFVFVSTAYSNCILHHIKEEFYEPPLKPEKLLSLVNALDDEVLQAITPQLLNKWPNTYVYTKGIAEDVVKSASANLPITVVRPAIVVGTAHEPMPGWIDNVYGPMGIVLGSGLGLIRSTNAKPEVVAQLVPVDYVCNCILAAAWRRSTCGTTTIYNYVGDEANQLNWGSFMAKVKPYFWISTPEKAVWYFCFQIRGNRTWHKICTWFLHTIPAYIVDFILVCLRKPTMAVKIYQRLDNMLDLLSFFSTQNWLFDDGNVRDLWKAMNDEDRRLFSFKMDELDWDMFYHHNMYGVKSYILKESLDNLPKAYRKRKLLFAAHYTLVALLLYLLYKFVVFVLRLFL